MPRLAVYDVMGIQDFVFRANELKLNIGASQIVHDVLTWDLPEIMCENLNNYELDWKKAGSFRMLKEQNLEAEIVYVGGGNALVAFQDRNVESKINRALSRRVFEKSYSLGIASASIDTAFNSYAEDKGRLFKELNKNKSEYQKSAPLQGISVTKQDNQTGLPVIYEGNRKSYTAEAWLKEQAGNQDRYMDLISDKNHFTFTNLFDQLGRREGESKIAIIHIDGNSMGTFIDQALQGVSEYGEAVNKMRYISTTVDKYYHEALKKTVKYLEANMDILDNSPKIKIHKGNSKKILPMRPIIQSGDDVTFVCHASLAINLAEKFLKEINKCRIEGFPHKLSACAGIVIVSSHFPFARAYAMAEECCASAKAKAKILEFSQDGILSWLDFHLVPSGIVNNLGSMRSRYYQLPGMENPSKPSTGNIRLHQYNLLWRPYLVNDDNAHYAEHNIKAMKRIIRDFQIGNNQAEEKYSSWPRSRLKGLREAFMKGSSAVQSFLVEAQSRGYVLPPHKIAIEHGFAYDDRTPYFDALEITDIYQELERGEASED